MDYDIYINLGIALGLGLLVGLQREISNSKMAGIRTFPIVTVIGALTALLSQKFDSGWILALGGLATALLTFNSNLIRSLTDGKVSSGQTTEAAVILMYFLGAYTMVGERSVSLVIGAIIALLLHLKPVLNNAADRLGDQDTKAIMQFVVISLIVLPVLPNEDFGPYGVFNPFQIWTLVVLIVGLSVGAYFMHQWIKNDRSILAAGMLGGMISSTATTISYARRALDSVSMVTSAFLILILAKTVSYVRVLIEVAIVTPSNFLIIAPPIVVVLIALVVFAIYLYRMEVKRDTPEFSKPDNPAQLKTALIFGLLYTIILYGVAASKEYFGQNGLYVISAIGGLTNMDAITLSLAQSVRSGRIDAHQCWTYILVASLANMVFKAGIVTFMGPKGLRRKIWLATFGLIVLGFILILLWP